METWKSLNGLVEYGEFYEVSNCGNVRSIDRYVDSRIGRRLVKGQVLKTYVDKDGYLALQFYCKQKKKGYGVHRLVALAFIENPENKPVVNHKDGIKSNNNVDNLEWATNKENTNHAFENNLIKPLKGEEQPNSKLTENQVREIDRLWKTDQYSMEQLAEMFNVFSSVISNIVNRKRWKHLDLGEKHTRNRDNEFLYKNKDIQDKVISLYRDEKYSLRKIENEVGVSRMTVRKILEEANLLKPLK